MNKTSIRIALAAVLGMAVAMPALAQGPGGGGFQGRRGGRMGGGGFGGPGGRGGMFGQGGPGAFGAQDDHNPMVSHAMQLIQRQDVRNELHLDLRQKQELDDYNTQAGQQMMQQMRQAFQAMRANRGQNNTPQDGQQADPAAQRQQMMQQMQDQRSAAITKINDGLSGILRPDQAARLHQLDLQWRGALSIADSKVGEEAQVSQDHRNAIQALLADYQNKQRDARQQVFQNMRAQRQANGGPNNPAPNGQAPQTMQDAFQAMQKADDAARKAGEEKALAALSDDEKASWTKVQGKPFHFFQQPQGTLR